MDKQTIILKNNPYPKDAELTESEQIWQFAGNYYALFNRNKWWIFLFCILGALAGLVYAFSKKNKFIAEVKFTSTMNENDMSGYVNLAQQFGLVSGGGSSSAFSGSNLMDLMKTPSLINKALFTPVTIHQKPVLFIDYYLQNKKIRQEWAKQKSALATASFNADLNQPDYLRDRMLKELDYNITKELNIDKNNKDLDFISVTMTDEDSTTAKVFAETLVKTVTEYYVNITTGKYLENVKVLQAKADSLSRNFSQRLSSIASAQDINVNPSRQAANVPIQRQQINMQADNAIYQEVVKNLELSKLQLQKETPFIQIIETPRYPLDELIVSKTKWLIVGFIAGGAFILFFFIAKKELTRFFTKLKAYSNS